MLKILCFGDSITYGAWDCEGGWVTRIRKKIDKIDIESGLQSFILTYNLGISSDTSELLLERFDAEIESHSKEPGAHLVIISIGTNDSIRSSNGTQWVEVSHFEQNIRTLIDKARRTARGVVFLGNLPVDESKTRPYLKKPGLTSTNTDIELYEHTTEKVCKELRAGFIPVFDGAVKKDYRDLLFSDGIHPNEKGHELLSEKVWDYLETNRWVVR